ncbi:MAG: YARHG domain-containing protein, partial [Turicibacter sp.]|nr:YARHG domain-containing protein [Turicibacter sp.]
MICKNCNTQLEVTAAFCNKCGTKIANEIATQPSSKKSTKIKIIISAVLVVLVIGGTVGFMFLFGGGEDNVADLQLATADIAEDTPTTNTAEIVQSNADEEEDSAEENGLRIATEFLSGFTTLFLDSDEQVIYLGNLMGIDTSGESWEVRQVIDNQFFETSSFPANVSAEPSFFNNGAMSAFDFSIFDIGETGLLIGVTTTSMFANGYNPMHVFKYVNGQYIEIGMIEPEAQLFRDTNGRLILREGHFWWGSVKISYVTFADTTINRQIIVEWNDDPGGNHYDAFIELGPGVSLMGLASLRLESLEEEIRATAMPIAQARFNEVAQNAQIAQPTPPVAPTANAEEDLRQQMITSISGFSGFADNISAYIGTNFALLTITDHFDTEIIPFIYNAGTFNRANSIFSRSNMEVSNIFVHPQYNAFSTNHWGWAWRTTFTTHTIQGGQFVQQNIPSFGTSVQLTGLGDSAAAIARLNNSAPLQHLTSTDNIVNLRNASGAIFPGSSTRLLNEDDFTNFPLSAAELRIARNEIFARHGRLFVAEDLQSHFNSLPWYNGTIAPADFTESML